MHCKHQKTPLYVHKQGKPPIFTFGENGEYRLSSLRKPARYAINALEVIYLPLYGSISKKTTNDLLDIAIKLTPKVVKNDKQKQSKMHDLLILLTGSFVSDEELNTILEANMRVLEDSPAVRVLEDRGRNQRNIEIAQNMLNAGEDYSKISRFTGLDIERITALDTELQTQAQL